MLNKKILYPILLFCLTIILYLPILPDFYKLLLDDNNSHGIFVPFISAYLIYKKFDLCRKEKIKPSKVGLWLLIFSLLTYQIGVIGNVEFLPRFSLILTIISLIIYNYGYAVSRHIWFPLIFLFFTVPVPVSIVSIVSLPLKMMSTQLSAYWLMLMGIPVLREGNMLYFSNASLEVAEACSGIRSIESYFMLATLFAYLMSTSISIRVFIVILAIPFAFFANLLRVTGTGILAHYFGNKVARGFLHEFSGMATFLFGFFMIMVTFFYLESKFGKNISEVDE